MITVVACITAFNALPLPVSTPFARDLAILTTKGADLGSGVATREERDVIFLAPKLMEREREKRREFLLKILCLQEDGPTFLSP